MVRLLHISNGFFCKTLVAAFVLLCIITTGFSQGSGTPITGVNYIAAPSQGTLCTYDVTSQKLDATVAGTVNNGNQITLGNITRNGVLTQHGSTVGVYNSGVVGATFTATDYLEFSITPNTGYALSLNALRIGSSDNGINATTTTPPTDQNVTWSLRSSLDNYATDLSTWTSYAGNLEVFTPISLPLQFQNIAPNVAVTFHIYAFNPKNGATTFRLVATGTGNEAVVKPQAAPTYGYTSISCKGIEIDGSSVISTPLTLQSFDGAIVNGSNKLWWTSNNENNVSEFVIESSADKKNFTDIGHVAAKNETGVNSYSFESQSSSAINYYRLKMIDNDGSYSYSPIVVLKEKVSSELNLFPNPAVNSIRLSHPKALNAYIEVIDIDGKEVIKTHVSEGTTETRINVSKLVKGTYQVCLINNGIKTTTRFIK